MPLLWERAEMARDSVMQGPYCKYGQEPPFIAVRVHLRVCRQPCAGWPSQSQDGVALGPGLLLWG